jgi:hypothetical protein
MAAMNLRPPEESGAQPRVLTGSRTRPRRPLGLLGHLARSTSDNARAEGVVFAARELLRMEGLLRAFRANLLETSLEVRGESYNMTLAMIELMIQREASSRSTAHPKRASQRSLVASRSVRADFASGPRNGSRARRRMRSPACGAGRQRGGAHACSSFAAHARHRSARADRTARTRAGLLGVAPAAHSRDAVEHGGQVDGSA